MKGFFSFLIGKLMIKCWLMTGIGLLFGHKWNKDTSEHREIHYPTGFHLDFPILWLYSPVIHESKVHRIKIARSVLAG
jgi:hypothetical protein